MSNFDPLKIRVRDSWAVVLMDERQDTLASGIYLPTVTAAEKVTEGAGMLVRVGEGKKNRELGLEPGMRICLRSYLKYANAIPNEETWPSGQGKEYFILNVDDILAIVPEGVQVGVYSRPAMGAVESVGADGKVTMKKGR
jgi:co-chaperonin GroES (HSP10)